MNPKLNKLDQAFEKSFNRPKVVLMPDIFIDHFIKLDLELTDLLAKIQEVTNRSGGILMGSDQKFLCGGHAGIAGSTLATLGAEVKIVAETDCIGESFAKAILEPRGIDLSLVSNQGKISSTAAVEFRLNGRIWMIKCFGSFNGGFMAREYPQPEAINITQDKIEAMYQTFKQYGKYPLTF